MKWILMKISPIIPFSTKPQMSKEKDTWHYYTHAEYKLVLLKCDLREKLINYCTILHWKRMLDNWISLFMILSMCYSMCRGISNVIWSNDHVTHTLQWTLLAFISHCSRWIRWPVTTSHRRQITMNQNKIWTLFLYFTERWW